MGYGRIRYSLDIHPSYSRCALGGALGASGGNRGANMIFSIGKLCDTMPVICKMNFTKCSFWVFFFVFLLRILVKCCTFAQNSEELTLIC